MSVAIVNFLSDIRNAAIANSVIVVFHVYIAFAVEGVSFLVIVLPIGVLIAAAYVIKGKIGAALLLIPTLGYLTVAPTLIEGLITLDTDEDIGAFSYLLGPFWLFTILLNIMSIVAEVRGTSKYGKIIHRTLIITDHRPKFQAKFGVPEEEPDRPFQRLFCG